MKHTAAFLALLACLTGAAMAETTQAAPQSRNTGATYPQSSGNQTCTTPNDPAPPASDPSAPQNQVEYGGGG